MGVIVEHVRALAQLGSVLGAETSLLQPHMQKIVQVTMRSPDLTVEESQEATALLREASLPEDMKTRLRTAFEERLRLPKNTGKAVRQNWCALPLYLPQDLLQHLIGEDGMYVKLDTLVQYLLAGVVTVLCNLGAKPALLHPETAHELFLKCKARARTYLDKAAPWTGEMLTELPPDPRQLKAPNVFFKEAPREIVMPPVFADFLLLCNSLPLRGNHALLHKSSGRTQKTARAQAPQPSQVPALLTLPPAPAMTDLQASRPLLALPAPPGAAAQELCPTTAMAPVLQVETSSTPLLALGTAADPPAASALSASASPCSLPVAASTPQPRPGKRSLAQCVEDLKQARKEVKQGKQPDAASTEPSLAPKKEGLADKPRRHGQKTAPEPRPVASPARVSSKKGPSGKQKAVPPVEAAAFDTKEGGDMASVDGLYVVYATAKSYLLALTGGRKRLLMPPRTASTRSGSASCTCKRKRRKASATAT